MYNIDEKTADDIYYVCSLVEYIGRATCNSRRTVVDKIHKQGIARLLRTAEVNHCLSFEQVSDETIEEYKIEKGTEDSVGECRYTVPTVLSIGRVYQRLVLDTCHDKDYAQGIINVFTSFISDEISYFNSNVYYSNPDYLRCSYEANKLLD